MVTAAFFVTSAEPLGLTFEVESDRANFTRRHTSILPRPAFGTSAATLRLIRLRKLRLLRGGGSGNGLS